MKKILYSLLAGFLLLGPMSCKKDDPAGPSLASSPEANAAEDNKSGGVYKGAVIGSSGTIKIVLQGGKKEIVLKIDGVTKTLTTTSLNSWTSGDIVAAAEFTSGDWSLIVDINADGTDASITGGTIPGHPNLYLVLKKEKSDKLIMAYEGTYAGTDSGTWNFVIQDNIVYGVSRDTNGAFGSFYGTVSGTAVAISIYGGNATAAGTVSGNTVSGTWTESTDVHGTFTGTRTL